MSFPLSRASLTHTTGIFACAYALVALCGCYHGSPAPGQRSSAESIMVGPAGQTSDAQFVRRFPGVDIVATRRGGFFVQIHSGMVGDGEPLYEIDGLLTLIEQSRGIDWFKPEDIAQIKVLKTPAETSVYGPRGVNGVIVITTKQAAPRKSRLRLGS